MAWVVDTCVLLDIYSADPQFAQSSADCLANYLSDGLVISPVTYVELAPAFEGNTKLQEQFLAGELCTGRVLSDTCELSSETPGGKCKCAAKKIDSCCKKAIWL